MRRALTIPGLLCAAALSALFCCDLRHRSSESIREVSTSEGHGQLLVGTAASEIRVPYPVVPAGYGPLQRHEVTSAAQPQMARAIALEVGAAKLTLVSVDLLEIDSRLLDDLRPRLPRNAGEIWVCATHTHSGMGNYDPNLLAQIAGTGRYKPAARDALLDAIAHSVTRSQSRFNPVELEVGGGGAAVADRSHSQDPPDERSVELAFQGANQVSELIVLGAHPTLTPRPAGVLDSDFPAAIESSGTRRNVVAFFQGAGGNASLIGDPLPSVVAQNATSWPLSRPDFHLDKLEGEALAIRMPAVEIHAGPSWTRRAAANLVDRLAAPREATLSVARLGPLTLIAVPGEPTAAAGRELEQAVGDSNAIVLGLCNGYVGYIETPDRVAKGIGESPRQYYDSSLLGGLAAAAAEARERLGPVRPKDRCPDAFPPNELDRQAHDAGASSVSR